MPKIFWVVFTSGAIGLAALFLFYNVNSSNYGYLLSRRLPVLLAILLGAWAAGSATLTFQTIADNQIVTPGLMGIEGLFVLSKTALLLLAPGLSAGNPLIPFGIAVAVLLAYSVVLMRQLKLADAGVTILLLTGIVAATLFGSINAFLQKALDPNEFSILQAATLGSINNVNSTILAAGAALALLCSGVLICLHSSLDVLALGKDSALSLGVHYQRTVRLLVLASLGLTAVSTAVIGPFPFLGLVVVSLTRLWYPGFRHGALFPAAFVTGFAVLLGGHLIVERVLKNQITLPVFLNMTGGIVFLILMTRRKNHAAS